MKYTAQNGQERIAAMPPKLSKPFLFPHEQLSLFYQPYQVIEKRPCDEHYALREYRYPNHPTYSDCKKVFNSKTEALNYSKTYGIQLI